MLHDNINIGLMVHAEGIEEARAKRNDSDSKKTKSFKGGATKDRLWIQENP